MKRRKWFRYVGQLVLMGFLMGFLGWVGYPDVQLTERPADVVFTVLREIPLRAPGSRPLLSVTDVGILKGGGLAVADGKGHCVHLFDAEGAWIGAFGQVGDGPGEFRTLSGLLVDRKGDIYTSDASLDRITVWDSSGQYIRDFSCTAGVGRMVWAGSDSTAIATLVATAPDVECVAIYDLKGRLVRKFGKMSAQLKRLWMKLGFPLAGGGIASADGLRIVIFHRAVYELRLYTLSGRFLRPIQTPRNSPYKPITEAPTPGDMRSVRQWEKTWTRLSSVAIVPGDFLLVEMLDMAQDPPSFLVDVIGPDGDAVYTGVPVDFLILRADKTGRVVCVQERQPSSPGEWSRYTLTLRRLDLARE